MTWNSGWVDGEIVDLKTADDVTDAVLAAMVECAEGAYMLGNRPVIDWEVAYGMLENQYGFALDEFDSPADRKIRRHIRAVRAESDL